MRLKLILIFTCCPLLLFSVISVFSVFSIFSAGCAARYKPSLLGEVSPAPAVEPTVPGEIIELTQETVIPEQWHEHQNDKSAVPDFLVNALDGLKARLKPVADGEYTLEQRADRDQSLRLELPPAVFRGLVKMLDDRIQAPLLGLTIVKDPERQTHEVRGVKLGLLGGGIWLGYEMLNEKETLGTIEWQVHW